MPSVVETTIIGFSTCSSLVSIVLLIHFFSFLLFYLWHTFGGVCAYLSHFPFTPISQMDIKKKHPDPIAAKKLSTNPSPPLHKEQGLKQLYLNLCLKTGKGFSSSTPVDELKGREGGGCTSNRGTNAFKQRLGHQA